MLDTRAEALYQMGLKSNDRTILALNYYNKAFEINKKHRGSRAEITDTASNEYRI
jgi:hypothetical protein